MATEEYERAHLDGVTQQILKEHDRHLLNVNDSIETLATQMKAQTLALERMGLLAASRDATAVAATTAVKDFEVARATRVEQTWLPWQKVFVVLAGLVGIATGINACINVYHLLYPMVK